MPPSPADRLRACESLVYRQIITSKCRRVKRTGRESSFRSSWRNAMAKIEEIFFLPPMAVARLGGSDVPLVSYTWLEDPSLHGAGLTVISPSVSLEVLADGAVHPFVPAAIQFRDGDKFRPVAPFLELWVRSNGTEQPVTLKWMNDNKAALTDIQYTVTAANRKAARRSGDAACAFSAQVKV